MRAEAVEQMFGVRAIVASLAGLALVVGPAVPALAAAPGGPGVDEQFLPADKSGFGTSTTAGSMVWLTVQKEGGLGEIYYPDLSTPSARTLDFVVADGHGHASRAADAARVRIVQTDPRSLSYRQEFVDRRGGWSLSA